MNTFNSLAYIYVYNVGVRNSVGATEEATPVESGPEEEKKSVEGFIPRTPETPEKMSARPAPENQLQHLEQGLMILKKEELMQLCKSRGVAHSGVKLVLVRRILAEGRLHGIKAE